MSKPRYTKEPGRWIHRDGQPFFALKRYDGDPFVSPTEVDDMAGFIVHLLNTYDEGMLRIIDKEHKS